MNSKLERIEALEAEIKKLKAEFSEPEFEVGKWYKGSDGNVLFFLEKINFNHNCEFSFSGHGFDYEGNWNVSGSSRSSQWTDLEGCRLSKATESEVFEALKKEAIKRGFKEGVTFDNSMLENCSNKRNVMTSNNLRYQTTGRLYNNTLLTGNIIIFNKGKWAEIIDEPFKVCGYEVRQINKGSKSECFLIGCKTIGRERLEKLSDLMTFNHFKTVQFDEYKVTLEEINKILEL